MGAVMFTRQDVLAGEVVDIVLEGSRVLGVLACLGLLLLQSEVLGLDQAVQQVVLLAVLLVLRQAAHHTAGTTQQTVTRPVVGLLLAGPLFELPLDGELGRLLLLLLPAPARRLGGDGGGDRGEAWAELQVWQGPHSRSAHLARTLLVSLLAAGLAWSWSLLRLVSSLALSSQAFQAWYHWKLVTVP